MADRIECADKREVSSEERQAAERLPGDFPASTVDGVLTCYLAPGHPGEHAAFVQYAEPSGDDEEVEWWLTWVTDGPSRLVKVSICPEWLSDGNETCLLPVDHYGACTAG